MTGSDTERKGGRRRRRRPRGKKKARPDRLAPLSSERKLDLERPADQPLSADEIAEMKGHLAFLRRFKGALRLSLNAAEDLLITGVRDPTDRGVCRHLLAKVDRAAVTKALARDALKSNRAQRAQFLAGVIRIDPEPSMLFEYLQTLAATDERRDAAAGFALTVERIDFGALSSTQIGQLLGVVWATFSGHDRVQTLFGLLSSESFRRKLQEATIDTEMQAELQPLRAAHRVLVRGEAPPPDDGDRRELLSGVKTLLSSPPNVLRSYPEHLRAQLAELALTGGIDDDSARKSTRKLLDTLPTKDERYSALKVARIEQLMRTGDEDLARPLLAQLTDNPWAKRRLEALDWTRVGRVAVSRQAQGRLRRGFWFDEDCFAWVRTADAEAAGVFTASAKLQSELRIPGIAPVLKHGMSSNGQVFAVLPPYGRPFDLARSSRKDALRTTLEGVRLLAALASVGVQLPDFDPRRLLHERGRLILADLDGARRGDPGAAAIAHGALAATWCVAALEHAELDADLKARLQRPTPLAVRHQELTVAWARLQG